jgi:hypothetical protein
LASSVLAPIYEQLQEDDQLDKAVELLVQRWKQQLRNDKDLTVEEDITTILTSSVLHKSPHPAEAFIKGLQQHQQQEEEDGKHAFRPSRHHYHIVMQAWHDFIPPSAKRAQALLEFMDEQQQQNVGGAGMAYETESCNLVLQTWARTRNAEGAQALLDRMVERGVECNEETFRHVLKAWSVSKSPRAPQKAEAVLSQMMKQQQQHAPGGWKPSAECYLRVMESYTAKSGSRKGSLERIESLYYKDVKRLFWNEPKSQRTPQLLQAAMLCVLQAHHKNADAHRAEEVLLEFAEDYSANGVVPPTVSMCLSVLATWGKSKSSRRATRAEKLLSLMEKDTQVWPTPDMACYTSVLHCWANSNKPNAAKRAELLLRLLQLQATTSLNDTTTSSSSLPVLSPNLHSYTCVLHAWANSDDPEAPMHAERIFAELQEEGLQPDRLAYAAMISAWGRSQHHDAAYKADDYLMQLKEQPVQVQPQPNGTSTIHTATTTNTTTNQATVIEYTATMQAWAQYVSRNVDASQEAVARVEGLLVELLEESSSNHDNYNKRPTALTYAVVLKTIAAARLVPDRNQRAKSLLRIMERQNMEISPYIRGLVEKCKT